jgi:DNA-binding transcriptional MerR regulator
VRSGELAQVSGVSTDSLRHYERLRILPKPPRTNGGYRNYPPSSLARVRLIRSALSIGFSLPEVAAVLKLRDSGAFPCHEARKIAQAKLVQVRVQLRELNRMRRQLERILDDWDTKLAQSQRGKPARLLESLPQIARRSITKSARVTFRARNKPTNGDIP